MHTAEYVQHLTHLLSISQTITKQARGGVYYLCQEISRITQGRVQLLLRKQGAADASSFSPLSASLSLPVQFGHMTYGTLWVAPDPEHPASPALPLDVAHLFAKVCSWLLYTLEQATFLHSQYQRLDSHLSGSLTRREREVLALMCRGYDQKEIARELCIAPPTVGKHRQHIYEQLGVHNERDAVLSAYHIGLFSPFEHMVSEEEQGFFSIGEGGEVSGSNQMLYGDNGRKTRAFPGK